MKKTREQRGITLIALIITIVVLLILAVVAINSIQNDGIISKAEGATNKYNESVGNEATQLQNYVDVLNQYVGGSENDGLTVSAAKNRVLSTTSNTEVYDEFGNKIVVPAGFKIRVDDTTNNAENVTEGIVVEDENGNQFVWIPVGEKVYKNAEQTQWETIELLVINGNEKYNMDAWVENIEGASEANGWEFEYSYDDFLLSATTKGGYYIGRYEAGNDNNKLVCKADQTIYECDSYETAVSLISELYADSNSNKFTCSLTNLCAFGTAISFVKTFGTDDAAESFADDSYEVQTSSTSSWGTGGFCNLSGFCYRSG